MANLWTPEAERLDPLGYPGTMMGIGGAKAIAHCTVGTDYDLMHRVLRAKQGEPHYLYDVRTDRLGQYFSLAVSSRSLQRGFVDVSCNKAGPVVIQIEFVAAPDGFTRYWQPGPRFRAMMRDIRDQGVPDIWIAPVAQDSKLTGTRRLDWQAYLATPGWIGHCSVPAQDHWDPGPIDQAAIFDAAPVARFDPAIKALQTELAAVGLLTPGDVDGIDGPITQAAKEAYMATLDSLARDLADIKGMLTVPVDRPEWRQVLGTGKGTLTLGELAAVAAVNATRGAVVDSIVAPEATAAVRAWEAGGPKPGQVPA